MLVSARVLIIREPQADGSRRINYPQAYKLTAGVIIIRAGGSAQKLLNFSKKSHSAENCRTVPKIVTQCRKRVIPYLCTLRRMLLPILIH